MSGEEDTELRDLVAQTLETNGVLNKIRAELRANVFLALEEQDATQEKCVSNKELKSFLETKEGHQAFSVVREFLQFFNLDFTIAVLDPESSYAGKASSRDNLINEMNLTKCDANSPLLVEIVNKKIGDGYSSSSSTASLSKKQNSSKIPQRLPESKLNKSTDAHKNKDYTSTEQKRSLLSPDDADEDELLKELGVSPISFNSISKKTGKANWLNSEPANTSIDNSPTKVEPAGRSRVSTLGSLRDAPPVPGVGGFTSHNESGLDVTSPEWDDLMKIDQKISELGFEIPKEDNSLKEKKSSKDNRYSYDDEFFNATSSEKSGGLSITEEIEGDLSIGSFAGSKADDLMTTDQTVSQISATGFDYGEEAEF